MRISVSLRSGHPGVDGRTAVRWMLERADAAAQAGLDGLYVGDQHVTPISYVQNSPILGRLLGEWERTVGALYLLPLWHPVIVAEQVATLACIAPADRFVLQCALGGNPAQFAGLGIDMRRRVRDFEANLDTVRRLLAGETVTVDGPHALQEARIAPLPPGTVEVWIGASADKAIGRAARLGDAWYAGPELTFAAAETALAHYRARLAASGGEATGTPIRRDVYVADSAADADDVRTRATSSGYRGIDPEALAIGTPDQVAAHFRTLGELGFDEIVTRQLVDDHERAVASTRRLADVAAELDLR